MKSSLIIAALGAVALAGPVFGPTPPAGSKPATPAPATPAAPAPQQPAPTAQPPRPFPEGAKIAFVNVQRIAQESAEGKGFTAKINALREKKEKELADKNSQLDAA